MRPHGKYAVVNPNDPEAFAQCERCGFWYNRSKLAFQTQWAGQHLYQTGTLVCITRCFDVPQEQLRTITLPPDPPPVVNARPPNFTYEENGPVQSTLTANVVQGAMSLPISDAEGFVVGNLVYVQLIDGTFGRMQVTGVDPVNNVLSILSPLPAGAPNTGTVTVSSTS